MTVYGIIPLNFLNRCCIINLQCDKVRGVKNMMDKINIAVCEDEIKWRDELLGYLKKYKLEHRNIEWEYYNQAAYLLDEYKKSECKKFDMIITDIEIQGLSGTEMANAVRRIDENVIIIFLTQYTKYMRDCFLSEPFRFWDKPISHEKFRCDMNMALDKITKIRNRKSFSFMTNGITYRIPYSEIFYFSAELKKIAVHLEKTSYRFYGKVKDYAKRWEENGFVCCHRSYYVNIECVEYMKKESLYLSNGEELSVSQSHMKAFKTYMLEAECRNAVSELRGKRNEQ